MSDVITFGQIFKTQVLYAWGDLAGFLTRPFLVHHETGLRGVKRMHLRVECPPCKL